MVIDDNIIKIIKELHTKLEQTGVQWILTGSTALAMRGVDIQTNDIDILTNRKDVKSIDKILNNYRIQYPDLSETNNYRSYYGIYEIDGIKIDLMGDFQYKLKNSKWSDTNQNNKIEFVDFHGMPLPMLTLQQELKEYENTDRQDTVLKIKEYLEKTTTTS